MKFLVEGVVRLGSSKRKFRKEVEARSERMAREYTYKLLGSHHRIKRTMVEIKSVKEVKG